MKISELIAELERIREEHGDAPCKVFLGHDVYSGGWEDVCAMYCPDRKFVLLDVRTEVLPEDWYDDF